MTWAIAVCIENPNITLYSEALGVRCVCWLLVGLLDVALLCWLAWLVGLGVSLVIQLAGDNYTIHKLCAAAAFVLSTVSRPALCN